MEMDEAKAKAVTCYASHLTRSELLMRRFHNLKRLSKCYRHLYWALMKHLTTLYSHYVYALTLSPFKLLTCAFLRCNFAPMPLTSFCHFHILSDSTQNLYKPCSYVIKGAEAGPITCGKPILRSTVPALCTAHYQKAQKHLTRAFKRNGLNISSASKMAPKFNCLVTEYINLIQARRRQEAMAKKSKIVLVKENDEVDAEIV
ncbi:hypothetical protein Fmac_022892 [Flemingia macrophylla]|uniref:KAT8 regulatory NSL complex subunit 2 n=1 Tax=Flemingia macrophylla TaxID=520843 RepID=A0ABD1LJY1_9FABA